MDSVRIMCLGDSITAGHGTLASYRESLWQSIVSAGYAVDMVGSQNNATNWAASGDADHEGHGGWTADQVLAQTPTYAAANSHDVCLLLVGTNDCYAGDDPAGTVAVIGQIIDALLSANASAHVLVGKILPRDAVGGATQAKINEVNALLPALCTAKGAQLVDLTSGFVLADHSDDNVHPNAAGEAVVAANWWSAVGPLLAALLSTPTASGADALRWYHTGAGVTGESQPDPALCLGGFRSSTAALFKAVRREQPIRGIVIEAGSAYTGHGPGSLAAPDGDLQYTPRGDAAGTAVSIAEGETVLVEGDDPSHWLRVRRLAGETLLSGTEVIGMTRVFNNAVGMGNVEAVEAATGSVRYRQLSFRNEGSAEIDTITFSAPTDQGIRIAVEVPVSGETQDIADDETAPTGLSWADPYTTPVVVSALASGAEQRLWIERTIGVGAGVSAQTDLLIEAEIVVGADTWTQHLTGSYRVAGAGLPRWETFVRVDGGAYDWNTPDATGAANADGTLAAPYELPALASGHTYGLVVRCRNKWGLTSLNTEADGEEVIDLAGDGTRNENPPIAPSNVTATPIAGGGVRLTGIYESGTDETIQADSVVAWLEHDGSTPDGSGDHTGTHTLLGVLGVEVWQLDLAGPYMDGAQVQVLVRTRRDLEDDEHVDSTNTAVVTCTVRTDGPRRPNGLPYWGKVASPGMVVVPVMSRYVIDEATDIYVEPERGSSSFYVDGLLVWRLIYDSGDTSRNGWYVPTELDLWGDSTLAGAASAHPVEVAAWDPDPRMLYVATYQPASASYVRRLSVDVDNARVTYTTRDATRSPIASTQAAALAERWDGLCWQVYDGATESWVTVLSIASDGTLVHGVDLVHTLTQAEIEAL